MEYSLTEFPIKLIDAVLCLNPFSNGILSDLISALQNLMKFVLILILMEYSLTHEKSLIKRAEIGLNPYSNGILSDAQVINVKGRKIRLNPYSNGILSDENKHQYHRKISVLILILMEYSLTFFLTLFYKLRLGSLNPYSNGILSDN